jgi:hypothetical protein
MKFVIKMFFVAIALFIICTNTYAANSISEPPPKSDMPKKPLETTYFWGFVSGDRCLHLFAIQDRGYIDFDGRYVSDFYYVQMNIWNYTGTTTICPQELDEWYV